MKLTEIHGFALGKTTIPLRSVHWRIQGGAGPPDGPWPPPPSLLMRLRVLKRVSSTRYSVLDIGAANRRLITKLKCVQGCLFVSAPKDLHGQIL